MQQMVIELLDTLNIFLSSSKNPITGGRQSFETTIIAGVNKTVEMMICHLRIFSIEPDLLSIFELIKKINFYYLRNKIFFKKRI
jgi:hypothetical protein